MHGPGCPTRSSRLGPHSVRLEGATAGSLSVSGDAFLGAPRLDPRATDVRHDEAVVLMPEPAESNELALCRWPSPRWQDNAGQQALRIAGLKR